jgi:hypothetical protein
VLPLPLEHNLQPFVLAQLGGQLHWETTFHIHISQPTTAYEVLFPVFWTVLWIRIQSDPDADPYWIRIQSGQWIRIRILNQDLDPGGQKCLTKAGRTAPLGNISRSHLPNQQLCIRFCFQRFGQCCGYESGQIRTVRA